MIKLGKNGEIQVHKGFTGVKYKPDIENERNVFIGDMTMGQLNQAEKVKMLKQAKAKEVARQVKQKYIRQKLKETQEELRSAYKADQIEKYNRANQLLRDMVAYPAMKDAGKMDSHHLMGDGLTGFGEEAQNISKDEQAEYEIASQEIRDGEAYGISTWLEPQTTEYASNEIRDAFEAEYFDSNTAGKRVMQTNPDYVNSPFNTMINMPAGTMLPGTRRDTSEVRYTEEVLKTLHPLDIPAALRARLNDAGVIMKDAALTTAENAEQTVLKEKSNKMLAYGAVALAALLILRR